MLDGLENDPDSVDGSSEELRVVNEEHNEGDIGKGKSWVEISQKLSQYRYRYNDEFDCVFSTSFFYVRVNFHFELVVVSDESHSEHMNQKQKLRI